MLDVFLTVDVEVWCDGWNDIDAKFPDNFRKYVHGPTATGSYGLPFQLQLLRDHGLSAVFFTEPLFSTRFGHQPLADIVGLVVEGGGQVELHLHPEWADEATEPLLPNLTQKLPSLRACSAEQQHALVGAGLRLLAQAGAPDIRAFRAGGFGFNRDTLLALASHGVAYDSSYNASMGGMSSGVATGSCVLEPTHCEGVIEVPMSNFNDGTSQLRHAQLTACSWRELEGLLWQAAEQDRPALTLLWHNFELLNSAKDRVDEVVLSRFRRLCRFLDHNRDTFCVRGFKGPAPRLVRQQAAALRSPRWKTGWRMAEQIYRQRWA